MAKKKPVNPWTVNGNDIYYRGELAARMTSVMGDDVVLSVMSKFMRIAQEDNDRLMLAINERQSQYIPPSMGFTLH
ncbi:hypothetical protein KF3_067 [Vibrio phage vB_VpaS_KF3]|nr:hypothetical protein KF3_067 [Vibrio phage vB_VpaS_KF3]